MLACQARIKENVRDSGGFYAILISKCYVIQ